MDNLPSPDKLPAVLRLWRDLTHDGMDSGKIDHEIADVFGLPLTQYTTSVESAFAFRDAMFKGYDYVNVDLREYDDSRGLVFICDIKTENGESSARRSCRAAAITKAVIDYVVFEMENVS